MSFSDGEYFRRRAQEEREAADQAASDQARDVHIELAVRYEHAAALSVKNVLAFEPRRSSRG